MTARRQHHVWQHYLSAWADKGKLYCLAEGRIFQATTVGVAVERDFYRLKPLSSEEISFIRSVCVMQHSEAAKSVSEAFLLIFASAPTMMTKMGASTDPDLIKRSEAYLIAAAEEYHSRIESSAIPLIRQARQHDLSFRSDDYLWMTFLHFITLQYFRTKGLREKIRSTLKLPPGYDAVNIWNVAIYIFAINVAINLFTQGRSVVAEFLVNDSDVRFVTGDQPSINLLAVSAGAPTSACIYYPLSPTLAIVIGDRNPVDVDAEGKISAGQVLDLNRRLVKSCHRQIFGNSELALSLLV